MSVTLLPLTHSMNLEQLAHDGLAVDTRPRSFARSMLASGWDAFEHHFPRAVMGSPHPFTAAGRADTVNTVYAWEKRGRDWNTLGRMPRSWVDGTIRPSILALVRFDDDSILVFKRHPRKDNAGGNASFLLMAGIPFTMTEEFRSDLDPACLDDLLALFDRHATPALLANRSETLTGSFITRPFGSLNLHHGKAKELKKHDTAVSAIFQTYHDWLIAYLGQKGYQYISLTVKGRRLDSYGNRTPLDMEIHGFLQNRTQQLFDTPHFDAVLEKATALSDSLHPLGAICMDTIQETDWLRYVDETEDAPMVSNHDVMEASKPLMIALNT